MVDNILQQVLSSCSLSCSALQEAIISHGCTVKSSNISSAVVGLRTHVEEGCTIDVSSARCQQQASQGRGSAQAASKPAPLSFSELASKQLTGPSAPSLAGTC